MVTTTSAYAEALEGIIQCFEYQYCDECGLDIDAHAIIPGPLGLPFAMCMNGEK